MKVKLNLGSGVRLFPGYTNVDILDEKHVKKAKGSKYVQADIRDLPFEDNSVDQAEMYSVLEHIPFREVTDVLKEVYRVLKPKGKLIIQTDDFDNIAMNWIEMRINQFDLKSYQVVMETVYGNQQHGGEFHKTCMTSDFLNWALINSGFENGTITKYPKNTKLQRFGGMFKPNPKMVYKNTQLVAEVEK